MNNQRRVLAEVLAIDAWHDPIRTDGSSSAIHVELSFKQGRLGGDDPDFPFTFNVALKRATLTVTVERPLAVDRNTVARNIPANQGELTSVLAARKDVKARAELGGKITPAAIVASLKGSASMSAEREREEKLRLVQQVPKIIAVPIPMGPQDYAWELTPGYEETLDGQPWDPTQEPRFSLKPVDHIDAIGPTIKAVVSCKLEDIHISDLEIKDSSMSSILKEMVVNKVNAAAAIQHIKLTLKQYNLEVGKLEDRFSAISIADILSTES